MKKNSFRPYLLVAYAFTLTLCIAHSAPAQIITSIAGNGTLGYGGDGGPAISAMLNEPWGVAIDSHGNLYIGDAFNNRVRKVTPAGIITTIAGTGTVGFSGDGGPATAAMIHAPFGVGVDGAGNVYFSDNNNNRIRKIDGAGVITSLCGSSSYGYSGDGGPASAAQIDGPDGLAVDYAGNIYIPDANNHRIRKINTAGIISTICGTGTPGTSGDGGPATAAQITYASDIAVDNAGSVYFTDFYGYRVRKIDPSGIITTIAGTGSVGFSGDGGPATAATLNNPVGIDVDNCGNVYIGDMRNDRIRLISHTGIITTIAGTGSATYSGDGGMASAAAINKPHAICHDALGNLFFADRINYKIRRISTTNHPPTFTAGATQSLTVCENSAPTSINSLLTIVDVDGGQLETWDVANAPLHGTLTGFSTAITSTGTSVTPTGLTYTPATGFHGTDTFRIIEMDCATSDTLTIFVTVDPLPFPGIITGTDSVCPGDTVRLSDTATAGIWVSSNTLIASISATGLVRGLTSGTDSILYIVTNACGSDTAVVTFKVRSKSSCPSGIDDADPVFTTSLSAFPNPCHDLLTVKLSSPSGGQVQLVLSNIVGLKVGEFEIPSNIDAQLPLHTPPGIYLLSAITGTGRMMTRIVVE